MLQNRVQSFAVLIVCLTLIAANWPQFRGLNGTGISDDKGIPVQWKEKEAIVWKTAIPGVGNSSPIIWGDRIFLQTSAPDGKERMLLCLDAKDGKIIWSRSAPGGAARTHQKNSLASSTPATDGQQVYTIFWNGREVSIAAYDFQGELRWTRDLGPLATQHGMGHSPIVFENKVFFALDQDDQAILMALDAKNGATAWQAPRKAFRACYSTPFILDKSGTPELIVASTAGVTSYQPQTGRENWNWAWNFGDKPLRTVASPIYSQGLVFATSGDGSGDRHAVAVRGDGKGDVSSTHLAWEVKKGFPYVPTLLARGEHIYYINDKGIASCRIAKTGEEVWSQRICGDVSASPVLIDGKIYVVSEEGDVVVFEAAPQFKLLGKSAVGERVIATPAVANNRLFIRGKTQLYCIGKPSGG